MKKLVLGIILAAAAIKLFESGQVSAARNIEINPISMPDPVIIQSGVAISTFSAMAGAGGSIASGGNAVSGGSTGWDIDPATGLPIFGGNVGSGGSIAVGGSIGIGGSVGIGGSIGYGGSFGSGTAGGTIGSGGSAVVGGAGGGTGAAGCPIPGFTLNVPLSNNLQIDALLYRWKLSRPQDIVYKFDFSISGYPMGIAGDALKYNFAVSTRRVLDEIEKVANVKFRQDESCATPTIIFRIKSNFQFVLEKEGLFASADIRRTPIDIILPSQNLDFAPDKFSRSTLMHEVFHALGLKHPGNTQLYVVNKSVSPAPYLAEDEDSRCATQMSYYYQNAPKAPSICQRNNLDKYPSTPMIYDIAALRYLYGPPVTQPTTYNFDYALGTFWNDTVAGGKLDISLVPEKSYNLKLFPAKIWNLKYELAHLSNMVMINPAGGVNDFRHAFLKGINTVNVSAPGERGGYFSVEINADGMLQPVRINASQAKGPNPLTLMEFTPISGTSYIYLSKVAGNRITLKNNSQGIHNIFGVKQGNLHILYDQFPDITPEAFAALFAPGQGEVNGNSRTIRFHHGGLQLIFYDIPLGQLDIEFQKEGLLP